MSRLWHTPLYIRPRLRPEIPRVPQRPPAWQVTLIVFAVYGGLRFAFDIALLVVGAMS